MLVNVPLASIERRRENKTLLSRNTYGENIELSLGVGAPEDAREASTDVLLLDADVFAVGEWDSME